MSSYSPITLRQLIRSLENTGFCQTTLISFCAVLLTWLFSLNFFSELLLILPNFVRFSFAIPSPVICMQIMCVACMLLLWESCSDLSNTRQRMNSTTRSHLCHPNVSAILKSGCILLKIKMTLQFCFNPQPPTYWIWCN